MPRPHGDKGGSISSVRFSSRAPRALKSCGVQALPEGRVFPKKQSAIFLMPHLKRFFLRPVAMINGTRQPDRRLSRRQRLTGLRQFERTYAQRRKFAGRFMVLWCYTGPDAAARLGVVASRKIGPAVLRNRARRRLREAFRLNRHRLQSGMDFVLVARRAAVEAAWNELVEELIRLAGQAGALAASGSSGQAS